MPRRVASKSKVEEPEELEIEETEDGAEELDDAEESDEVESFDDLEVDEVGEDEEEVEDLEDEPEEKPRKRPTKGSKAAKKPAAKKSNAPAFGTNELLAHVNEVTGKEMDGRALRIVLRKLAAEGAVQRTVGDDRGRYSFSGKNDPQVKAVVAAIKAGATEKKPAAPKKTAAKKPVAKAKAPAKRRTRKTVEEVDE